jgi:hypothetical protein
VTIDSRVHIQHAKFLFDPTVLSELRDHFTKSEGRLKHLKGLTERERQAMERGESSDAMRMQDRWYDVWSTAPSLQKLIDTLTPYSWVSYPVQVRCVRKKGQEVPWHQDTDYMRLLGPRGHKQIITCFIPIEPEPAKCTTIQFALDNASTPDKIYKHAPLDGFGAGVAGAQFKEYSHFDLTLGDALVFGDHTLHRTYTPEGCNIERRSLEFRLIRPQDALPDKDYFDIKAQTFIKTNEQRKVMTHG